MGTLTVPEGEGPFPAVVMVHGSGPQARDEVLDGSLLFYHSDTSVQVFAVLAEHLAAAGVASLRYDKRSCIARNSGGACPIEEFAFDVHAVTVHMFASDATAAAHWLRDRPEVHDDQVVMLGHSQGASLALSIAAEQPWLAGLVLIGCPAAEEPVADHTAQSERVLRLLEAHATPDRDRIEQLEGTIADTAEQLAEALGPNPEHPFENLRPEFWQSWFAYKEVTRQHLQSLEMPILAATGEFDWNLPVDPHLGYVRRWRGERSADRLVQVARASHALVALDPETFQLGVDRDFLRLLGTWVMATTGQGPQLVAGVDIDVIGSTTDPLAAARDALLCAAAKEECDFDAIHARMSPDMQAALPALMIPGLIDGRLAGNLVSTETLQVNVYGTGEEMSWCQEDLLHARGGDTLLLRSCWRAGPELVGLFMP